MEKQSLTGRIYDIQGFSVHDGPGIRTTVFLKGCPLRCPWCHSPESQSFHIQMSYSSVKCIGTELCGECLRVCPAGALSTGPAEFSTGDGKELHRVLWDRSKCLQCGACTELCFPEALSLCGRDYSLEEVMEKLRRDYNFFSGSKGGVTVSGGEPLSQLAFTTALLKALKEDGIHTALDTTGFAPVEAIEKVLPYVDLFLYDLKHMDSSSHESIVAVPNEPTLRNARFIASHGGKLQIRVPVIPGYNDSEENLRKAAEFCLELGDAVETVQLLPYHPYGASKYERIQMYNPMPPSVTPPSDETMEDYRLLFESMGLHAIIH